MTKEEAIGILKDCELNPCVPEDKEAADMAIKALEALQAQKVGKWHRFENVAKCSECGEITKIGDTHRNKYTGRVSHRDFGFKYCPKCGAKMESEDKE